MMRSAWDADRIGMWNTAPAVLEVYNVNFNTDFIIGGHGYVTEGYNATSSDKYMYSVEVSGGNDEFSDEAHMDGVEGREHSIQTDIQNGSNRIAKGTTTQTYTVIIRPYRVLQMHGSSWEAMGAQQQVSVTVPALDRVSLSYNANGGTSAPQSVQTWYGYSVTISNSTPTRAGYEFSFWSIYSDGHYSSYVAGDTLSIDRDITLYAIWNPIITFVGNGGSGIPSAFTKTFNASATVPSNTPTKEGYVFVEWNTSSNGSGTSYQPSGTIAASMNTATTLYAIWQKVTAAPTISSITVIRCNSSGTQNDAGTYAKITAVWSVDRTYDSSNTGSVTGRYRVSGSSSYTSFSFTSGASGANGTAVAIVSGFDVDTQYEFIVKVTDTNRTTGHVYQTERNVILTRAKFIMDLKAGGEAMGLFSAAPSEGLEIGKQTQIDDTLTVLGNVVATNLTLTEESGADVATASSSFTISSPKGYKYGPFRMVAMSFSSSSALTAETSYTLGALTSAYSTPKAIGFANQYGVGYVSGTSIYFKPLVSVSASTSLYVALTYIKP